MGHLKLACNKNGKYRGNYTGVKAPENLIRYVTRTRENEERREELLTWGVMGAYNCYQVDEIIHIFEQVQIIGRENKSMGPRMFHEEYILDEYQTRFFNHYPGLLNQFGYACAGIYYNLGFQVVFGVHCEPDNPERVLHIHFAGNAVNYINYKKWHTNINDEQRYRESLMEEAYRNLFEATVQIITPIIFINTENCVA